MFILSHQENELSDIVTSLLTTQCPTPPYLGKVSLPNVTEPPSLLKNL